MAARYSTLLPVSYLARHLSYDPERGVVSRRRKHGVSASAWASKPIAKATKYRTITVQGNTYMLHVVAWAMAHGRWPEHFIDHINGDKTDNRLCNLREASASENSQNQRSAQSSNQSSGLLGVTRHASGRWQARLWVQGRNLCIGTFDTPELAHEAYLAAKRARHPGCTI